MVTELDVLWGDANPWWGFDRLQPAIKEGTKRFPEKVALVLRMGVKREGSFFSEGGMVG